MRYSHITFSFFSFYLALFSIFVNVEFSRPQIMKTLICGNKKVRRYNLLKLFSLTTFQSDWLGAAPTVQKKFDEVNLEMLITVKLGRHNSQIRFSEEAFSTDWLHVISHTSQVSRSLSGLHQGSMVTRFNHFVVSIMLNVATFPW